MNECCSIKLYSLLTEVLRTKDIDIGCLGYLHKIQHYSYISVLLILSLLQTQ